MARLQDYAQQKLSEPFFLGLARLAAVLLEDIEPADPDDPAAEAVSAVEGISKIVRMAGMKHRPDAPEDWSLPTTFYECAKNWDLDGVADLLRSRWHWGTEPNAHSRHASAYALRDSYEEAEGHRRSESEGAIGNPFHRDALDPSRVLLAFVLGLFVGLIVLLFELLQ